MKVAYFWNGDAQRDARHCGESCGKVLGNSENFTIIFKANCRKIAEGCRETVYRPPGNGCLLILSGISSKWRQLLPGWKNGQCKPKKHIILYFQALVAGEQRKHNCLLWRKEGKYPAFHIPHVTPSSTAEPPEFLKAGSGWDDGWPISTGSAQLWHTHTRKQGRSLGTGARSPGATLEAKNRKRERQPPSASKEAGTDWLGVELRDRLL